jgi:hypothetical protein
VHAEEITVPSGNGARVAVAELAARFERATGHTVTIRFEVNPRVQRRIEAGEARDVAILNPPVLDDLIRQGKVVATRASSGEAASASVPAKARPRPTSPRSRRSRAHCSLPGPSPIPARAPVASTLSVWSIDSASRWR